MNTFFSTSLTDGDNMSTAPDYLSPIDDLFKDIVNEDDFNAKKKKIKAYVEEKTYEKKPTTESTGVEVEGGKKKRKSKKKTKKMKKSKKSKTAKKKKH